MKPSLVRIWLLCAAILPASVQAQFIFVTNNGAIAITGYTGSGGAVTIPNTINGLPVTSIGTNAFAGCTSLNSVAIPNTITSLGSFAFSGCTNLFSVFFGTNAPGADLTTLSNDNIASVYYLPGTTGWSSTFAGIPTVLLPYIYTASKGVISINGYAGSGGAVTIPGTIGGLPVTGIGANAFSFCNSLTSVTIGSSVTNIGSGAFSSCTNLASVTMGSGVTNIYDSAFYNCTSLTNLTFGNVASIGSFAFQLCSSLSSVTIPASIYRIESYAFADCPSLTGVYFQGNAPSAAGSEFLDDSLTVYYLPGTTGWSNFFQSTGVTTALYNPPVPFNYTTNNGAITITEYTGSGGAVTIPGTILVTATTNFLPVTRIGTNAFSDCSGLVSVAIPKGVTNLGSFAFSGCSNLISVFFASNAPSADSTVFLNDNDTFVYYLPGTTDWSSTFAGIPTMLLPYIYTAANGAITIRGYAGSGGTVTIPGMIGGLPVTSIGDEAFYQCTNLNRVTIPGSVTNIGHGAFAFCGDLISVIIPDSVTSIGICAFWNCTSLTSVTLGANAADIGISEFDSCSNLTSLTIPDNVLNIRSSALQNCGSLTNVTIGKNVASIRNSAFDSCSSLTAITVDPQNFNYGSVDGVLVNKSQNALVQCPGGKAGNYTVPNSVTNIGNSAFHSCAQLTSITIPASVTSIGDWAFDSCSGLANAMIGNNVVSVGSYAFASCDSLMNVTIPDSVTTIGYHAFDGCTGLTDVTIGIGLRIPPGLGSGIFSDCPNLTSIYLRGSAPYFVWNPTNQIATPTAYYLPWDNPASVSGLPTALWQPRIQNSDASFGFQANQFGFNINWASGTLIEVETCTNLANPVWTPAAFFFPTNRLTYFSDPQWTNYPERFYRIYGQQNQQSGPGP